MCLVPCAEAVAILSHTISSSAGNGPIGVTLGRIIGLINGRLLCNASRKQPKKGDNQLLGSARLLLWCY